jgi:hypothetical protein
VLDLPKCHRPFTSQKFRKNVISNPDERRGEKSVGFQQLACRLAQFT